jgi:hypothetical protein
MFFDRRRGIDVVIDRTVLDIAAAVTDRKCLIPWLFSDGLDALGRNIPNDSVYL